MSTAARITISSAKAAKPIRIGFVPLTDAAPLVMAVEMELFTRRGLQVQARREVGWATIRDKILYGELDAAIAPAGLVIAASLGIGCIAIECLSAFIVSLNGNAITVSRQLWNLGVHDAGALRAEILKRGEADRLVFGVPSAYSSHTYLLKRWLRACGIDPDRDVQIVIVPPPQMFDNLRAGHLHGYCVGEPWNSVAVQGRVGVVLATSRSLDANHPEKVLMVRADFARSREEVHLAMIAALREAGRFCDAPQNRERIIEALSVALPAPAGAIAASLSGSFDTGAGKTEKSRGFHIFARDHCNEPDAAKAAWVCNSLRQSGFPDIEPGDVIRLFRADIYHNATKDL